MESIESIEYKFRNVAKTIPQCLNKLDLLELQEFAEYANLDSFTFEELLTTKYADRTFCIQTDYDYMFGNISWQKSFFNFSDAEDAIFKDWEGREDQPHYTVDKSYIGIYKFSELKNSEGYDKEKIIENLQYLLKEKLKKNIDRK